jgi:hypothetical protein
MGSFWILAQQEPKLPINQLDPPTRTKVVMALLALVILALGAMVCIWLGGRYVKRIARYRTPRSQSQKNPPLPSDWDPKKQEKL